MSEDASSATVRAADGAADEDAVPPLVLAAERADATLTERLLENFERASERMLEITSGKTGMQTHEERSDAVLAQLRVEMRRVLKFANEGVASFEAEAGTAPAAASGSADGDA